jgi:hypothetical protein
MSKMLLTGSIQMEEDAPDWFEDKDLDDMTVARLVGIKVLTNRSLSYADTEDAKKVSEPVFKLLWSLISNRGDVNKTKHS